MTAVLTVWWGDQTVGALRIDRQGDIEFTYDEAWRAASHARAISVSLPLRAEPYLRRQTRPFFEGLLPEESQRIALARALGVSQQNEFRLLGQIGGEVAGATGLNRAAPPHLLDPVRPPPPEQRGGVSAHLAACVFLAGWSFSPFVELRGGKAFVRPPPTAWKSRVTCRRIFGPPQA